ncbi:hypothetical protein [Curtobacterium sp. P97]|uniref:hypothetical protein n=1 Tax=unclassified Curtobacterium TaxID=257496 RepID=UPI00203F9A9D|nr:hypothetical protein [Curtobacterium sp. P97]MCM3520055.1 hypothetical protein [Curtobacterium sp. P97]
MPRLHHLSVMLLAAVLVATGAAVAGLTPAEAAPAATAVQAGRYSPVPAARIFGGTVGTTPRVVPVAGVAGVPADATAVVLNVQVSGATADGYVRVTPAGSDPQVATQIVRAGEPVSNLATVRLAAGGVQVKLSKGSGTVFFDVSGYYGPSGGSTYTPLDAARAFGATVGTTPVQVPLAGTAGVPQDATAVAVNVETKAQTADGYVRVTAAGQDPQVATQVFRRGGAISNLVVTGLTGGAAQVKVSRGTATVYMDVVGYYSRSASGSVFVPITTTRVATTALGTTPRTIRVAGTGGVPGTATAVVANAQVSAPTAAGYLRLTPAGQDPQVATQDLAAGVARSALTMPKVTGSTVDRRVQAKVSSGTATLFLDVAGYFLDGRSGSGVGADVSWPQCGKASSWPTDQAFGIIGVNAGLANTTNPCSAQQLAWARASADGTSQPVAQLYVNTANPGAEASVWPTSNTLPGGPTVTNPYGVCRGGYDRPCSYVYGWTRAYEDVNVRGIPSGPWRWWLDAETDGTWQKDQSLNRATLEGMTDMFRTTGGSVGLYSSPSEWSQLFGTVPSTSQLYRLPTWRAEGPATLAAAQAACTAAPFTAGGRTEIVQYVVGQQDFDVSCV